MIMTTTPAGSCEDLGLGITATAYALPTKREALEQWGEAAEQPQAVIDLLRANGMDSVLNAAGVASEGWAIAAARAAVDKSGLDLEQIRLIVYFHTLKSSVPHDGETIITKLRRALGLNRALGFSLAQQNCVSYLAALHTVSRLLQAHPYIDHALLVGADVIDAPQYRPIDVVGLQSDGGAAALVSRAAVGNRLLGTAFVTFGEHYRGVHSGPEMTERLNQMYYLVTHKLICRLLHENGFKVEDVKLLLPHNVNLPGWKRILANLRMSEDRLYFANIPRLGHVFGCDGVINLQDAEAAGRLRKGDLYIVYSMGFGGCFGAALFRY